MTLLFLFCFIIIFFLLARKKLDSAILLTVILLPTYLIRFNIIVPTTLLEIMIVIVFLVWFIKNRFFLYTRWQKIIKTKSFSGTMSYPFRWVIIAWLLVSFIAVGIAGFDVSALGVWRAYFFEPLLLFIVVINTFQTREKIIELISALGISVIAVSLFAVYQYITGDFIANDFWANSINRRATSFFPFPNAVGLYVAPSIPLLLGALGFLLTKNADNKKSIIICSVGVVLGLFAITSARSEGALLALGLVLPLFGLMASKLSRRLTIILIAIGIAGLILSVPAQSYIIDRLTLKNFSGQVRRIQWKETLKMLYDGRLLTGAGLAQYQTAVAPYHQEGFFVKNNDPDFDYKVRTDPEFRKQTWQPLEIYLYPHNIILNFWSELGLLGLVTFIWLIITFGYYGWRSYQQVKATGSPDRFIVLGLGFSLLVSLIHGWVDVPYFKNDLAVLFWVIMALMALMYIRHVKKLDKN